jgi:hypothetical protein
MSQQRPIEHIVGKPKTSSEIHATKAEAKVIAPTEDEIKALKLKERQEKKAKVAAVLERGLTNDRLRVELPDHLHGEWVHRDPNEILRMQTLGFRIDDTYAVKRSIHTDGSSAAIIGDVVFMVTDKDNKEIIDEVKHEQFLITHGDAKYKERRGQKGDVPNARGGEGKASDEFGAEDPTTGYDISDMRTIDESVEHRITGTDVAEIVKNTINKPKE